MVDWMPIVAVIVATLVVVIALIAGLMIRRGFQIQLLLKDGTHIDGRVVRQWRSTWRGPAKIRYYLRYRYVDHLGNEHSRKMMAGYDYWTAHPPGSGIGICYSASKPDVSAPREVVELARKSMQGKSV